MFGFMRWTEDEPIAILPIARMRHFSVQNLKKAPVNVDNKKEWPFLAKFCVNVQREEHFNNHL